MNVVIYTRYSSHNQNEQSTIGQMEVCKKFCERNDFNIGSTSRSSLWRR